MSLLSESKVLFVSFLKYLRRTHQDIIINEHESPCKASAIRVRVSDCNETWNFSTDFGNLLKYQI